MWEQEILNENTNKEKEISTTINNTKKWLFWLEKWIFKNFFSNILNWFKRVFWWSWNNTNNKESSNKTTPSQQETNTPIDNSNTTPKYSDVDTRWFTPWEYPFAHLTFPYKWISAYRVDNRKLKPLIWFSQLSLKWTEWPLATLKVKNQELKFNNKKAIGYKKNNPCNISPSSTDIGYLGSSVVADWQVHWGYKTMEDWLASFMRLMRYCKNKDWSYRYRNKSIQWINCWWMQWFYKENEPDSLKALRISRITHACEQLNISPFARINMDNKETMMAFTQQTAIRETGSHFDRATLERAYHIAFPNEA